MNPRRVLGMYAAIMMASLFVAFMYNFFAGAALLPALALGIGFLTLSFAMTYAFSKQKMAGAFAGLFGLTFVILLAFL